jgi:RNA polymerase sigma-70 factor (ECF subfamily)
MSIDMNVKESPDANGEGKPVSFDALVGPYRRELKAYCYRMLGSVHEAEDLVQETLLRAWRGMKRFEGRGSVRSWLYRIATNACLSALAARASSRRVMPDSQGPPTTKMPQGRPNSDVLWLEPYPDSELEGLPDEAPGPAARYELTESIRLAFVAAIQHLPPRQRAVLLLCDVLGWSANEAAFLLGGSIASVNSVLQRARATLSNLHSIKHDRVVSAPTERQRSLLERYVQAWEHKDLEGFVGLLRKDASYRMPPWDLWYDGRDSIRSFFQAVWKSYGSFRLLRTNANRQPSFAIYTRVQTEANWMAHSIQVLDLDDDAIVSLTKFVAPLGPKMFRSFALPESLAPFDQPIIPH